MATLWDVLRTRGLTSTVVFDDALRSLLENCNVGDPLAGDDVRGELLIAATKSPLPLLSLNIKPPFPNCDYHLIFDAGNPTTSFKLFILLDTAAGRLPGAKAVLEFIDGLPGHVLTAATHKQADDGREWLEPVAGNPPATLEGLHLSLLITGRSGESAHMKLSPCVARRPSGRTQRRSERAEFPADAVARPRPGALPRSDDAHR